MPRAAPLADRPRTRPPRSVSGSAFYAKSEGYVPSDQKPHGSPVCGCSAVYNSTGTSTGTPFLPLPVIIVAALAILTSCRFIQRRTALRARLHRRDGRALREAALVGAQTRRQGGPTPAEAPTMVLSRPGAPSQPIAATAIVVGLGPQLADQGAPVPGEEALREAIELLGSGDSDVAAIHTVVAEIIGLIEKRPQLVHLKLLKTPSLAKIKIKAREGVARLEVGGAQAWVDGGCEGLWQSMFVAVLDGHTALAEAPVIHAVAVESLGV